MYAYIICAYRHYLISDLYTSCCMECLYHYIPFLITLKDFFSVIYVMKCILMFCCILIYCSTLTCVCYPHIIIFELSLLLCKAVVGIQYTFFILSRGFTIIIYYWHCNTQLLIFGLLIQKTRQTDNYEYPLIFTISSLLYYIHNYNILSNIDYNNKYKIPLLINTYLICMWSLC